ncbi:MAG: hypothetical protein QXY45_01540 [Candidatus Aenigmatarchaeota archaeon]
MVGIKMKKIGILLLILSIFLISGCTQKGGGGGGSGSGIIISSLIVDPPEIEGGEEVYILMDLQNVGGALAQNIETNLIGLPSGWNIVDHYGNPGQLYPPEKNIQGELATVQWTLLAPHSNTDIDYPFEVQVKYSYSTRTETLIRMVNRDWLMKLPYNQREEERKKQGTITSNVQGGPIQATVKAASTTGNSVILDIQNIGGGYPRDNRVIVQYEGMRCNNLGNGQTIELIRGQNKQFRCDVTDLPNGDWQWQNVRINVVLTYDYIIKSSSSIKVLGTPV